MNDIIACTYYNAELIISCWNEKLMKRGRVEVADLEGLFFYELPYNDWLAWTNMLTMDNFKRDKHGLYVLMLPDPKELDIW